jgi:hypothetical protein
VCFIAAELDLFGSRWTLSSSSMNFFDGAMPLGLLRARVHGISAGNVSWSLGRTCSIEL